MCNFSDRGWGPMGTVIHGLTTLIYPSQIALPKYRLQTVLNVYRFLQTKTKWLEP
ncbi:hypothetical protein B0H10DRAFT_2130957 [Mycena sp. CBHHK59/15]|nr:hypothetical protein B0H10DRAFT_2130957 [Mycena sp. CBHHK59/15]